MDRAENDLDRPDAPKLVPVYVRLRSFAAFLEAKRDVYTSAGHGALLAFLDHTFRTERNLDLTHDFFEKLLESGDCLVLLDGLDEVTRMRGEVAQQVYAFIRHYRARNNRFGVGSRPGGYQAVEVYLRVADLAVCQVNSLDLRGIYRLMEILFGLVEKDIHKPAFWRRRTSGMKACGAGSPATSPMGSRRKVIGAPKAGSGCRAR